ncbi:hypothetical protein P152DRAFT_446438 [Eremomyces bilateralis CBS 781.70]|uniref:Uncharacterized protein n=1 Tax=Eremomyces bilateralis CBS 781.70 TaxID=1392243 RepID=A0A6G1GBB5_9PEZI|nr:uncharacterized protein P152DRAFT_446438 [Eremomyces bilateralis CBS 781.70]KAF1815365.1 hypothetical protein P152DRAFT_446438 [Eremomyces bilateralis CBS 781.70]
MAPVTVSSSSLSSGPTTRRAPQPLPADLRASLTSALLAQNSIPRIHQTLSHELASSGWTNALREHVKELLRSGQAQSYGEVMRLVVEGALKEEGGKNGEEANGEGNGVAQAEVIKIPEKAVKEGLRVVRKELERVCEVVVDN